MESVEYLGMKMDTNHSWQYHFNDLFIKLDRANALLFKMIKSASLKILRTMYFTIFQFFLCYSLVRAQIFSTIQQIVILQKRLLELIFKQGMPRTVPYSNKPPSSDFMLKFV